MSILFFLSISCFKTISYKRYLQKNTHPKLGYISTYFQDVFFFFDNITMLGLKGFFFFFLDIKIYV